MQFRAIVEGVKTSIGWWWCLFICRIYVTFMLYILLLRKSTR